MEIEKPLITDKREAPSTMAKSNPQLESQSQSQGSLTQIWLTSSVSGRVYNINFAYVLNTYTTLCKIFARDLESSP